MLLIQLSWAGETLGADCIWSEATVVKNPAETAAFLRTSLRATGSGDPGQSLLVTS